MKRPSPTLWIVAALLFAFVYAPIAVVVAYSFNEARFGAEWTGFTTKWYGVLRQNEMALDAVKNTLLLATTSTVIATALGTLLAFGLSRHTFPGRKLFSWSLYLPVMVPDIVLAVTFLLFFGLLREWIGGFDPGMQTMILSHVTFQVPFVAIVVRARLAGMDPSIEEAARDLGANAWRTFRHVTLPWMAPGIAAGAMLAFTLSLDDFVVSFFTTGPGATTLPILIYSSVKRGITPDINALSTFMIAASMIATLLIAWLQRARAETGEIR